MAEAKTHRLINLDILRLVSAVLVVGFHYGFRMYISGEGGGVGFQELAPAAMWFDSGYLIFFAISGYVIAMSADNRPAYEFAAGRVARLWPTFFLCATITALVLYNWPIPGIPEPTLQQWLAHLVIISRALGQPFLDGAYWTIAYEIIFYGWVFVFLAIGWFQKYWRTIVLCWLAISVANELSFDSEVIRKLLITQYSGYFAFGLALYKSQQRFHAGSLLPLAAALLWASAMPILGEPSFLEMYGVQRSNLGVALIGPVTIGCVLLCALAPSIAIRPSLAIGLGGLTYPLYLLHQHIGYAAFARFGAEYDRWLIAVILLVVLIATSWVIARTVEPAARHAILRLSRDMKVRVTSALRPRPA